MARETSTQLIESPELMHLSRVPVLVPAAWCSSLFVVFYDTKPEARFERLLGVCSRFRRLGFSAATSFNHGVLGSIPRGPTPSLTFGELRSASTRLATQAA